MNRMKYLQEVKSIRDSLPAEKQSSFDVQFTSKEKSGSTAFMLSLFLGSLGIDRFYLGNLVLGFLKLVTVGGFFIWSFVDLFLVVGATRSKNIRTAEEVKMLVA